MQINVNDIFEAIYKSKARYIHLYGGRGRGGSTAGAQYATISVATWKYCRGLLMRNVLSDVRSSIFQEVVDQCQDLPFQVTDLKINYKENSLEGKGFKKADNNQTAKLKSFASYNFVLIEEADEVSEEDFDKLDTTIRTQKGDNVIVLVYNMPPAKHWILNRWFTLEPHPIYDGYFIPKPKESEDCLFIFGTYKDNEKNQSQTAINLYERYKETNLHYYLTMIQGLVSTGQKGQILKNYSTITNEEFENLPYDSFYGLDFGFSNDPASLISCKKHNDKLFLKELIYQKGLTNQMLAKRMEEVGITSDDLVYADASEPKSIIEISTEGFLIVGAKKGNDSVRAGIKKLEGLEIFVTEDSTNILEELTNYCWSTDKNKDLTNKPIDRYNHAIDAIRYAVTSHYGQSFDML
jgi:phage terminase large subunit